VDRYTLRGVIYAGFSMLGLGYELVFVEMPRRFLLVMYGIVIVIGLILVFFVEDK